MYAKLFQSMYDGTLGTRGPWEALVTFQQLLVLADRFGMVDMTPEAISRRTTIPLEIIERGLKALSEPDPQSRRDTEDGKRIIPIDPSRTWGWQIVNYSYYRAIRTAEERREYQRTYMRQVRAGKRKGERMTGNGSDTARSILAYLNEQTGKAFRPVPANTKLIEARVKEYGEATLKAIIEHRSKLWRNTDMSPYLRPATLFNATKCAQYAGELQADGKPVGTATPEQIAAAEQRQKEIRERSIAQAREKLAAK